jgi:hypothetical protein
MQKSELVKEVYKKSREDPEYIEIWRDNHLQTDDILKEWKEYVKRKSK